MWYDSRKDGKSSLLIIFNFIILKENPSGIMYRICIAVQIHPLFVTDSDRSYCAQCVYMDNNVIDDLEQNLSIR